MNNTPPSLITDFACMKLEWNCLYMSYALTECGKKIDVYRQDKCWRIREILPAGSTAQDKASSFSKTLDGKYGPTVSIKELREIMAPEFEFSPQSLLPLALDDPEEMTRLLEAGAKPNHCPAIVHDGPLYGSMGRLPLVIVDATIAETARDLLTVFEELPDPPASLVDMLSRKTNIEGDHPTKFRPTLLDSKLESKIQYLNALGTCRQILLDHGALEVADFTRAVRSHCFDEASEFLSAGLSVDLIQATGHNLLTDRILCRDDEAVRWLLEQGANPNFQPHPFAGRIATVSNDPKPVKEFADGDGFPYVWPRFFTLSYPLWDILWCCNLGQRLTNYSPSHGIMQPLAAAIFGDNEPALDLLLAAGANVHAIPFFQIGVPPLWAIERLAKLEIDWLQMVERSIGDIEPAVIYWAASRKIHPGFAEGLESWTHYASPQDLALLETASQNPDFACMLA